MLKEEQERTLATPRLRYGLLARLLFVPMDILYGKKGDLRKFRVLEVIARVPYQAWENVSYVAITHTHSAPRFARRIFEFVEESRRQQDNEQWHLFILEELIRRQGLRQGFFRFRLLPQLMAFVYYHVSWLLYVLKPGWSYRLNAEFEDHAEHEYMEFVAAHPELDSVPYDCVFCEDYGEFESVAHLLRRIGLDEREHKEESLARLDAPRFGIHAQEAV